MQFPFVSLFSVETTGPIVTKICARYSDIRDAIIFCINNVLFHSVSEWHSDKVDWSGKNANFSTLTGWHGNVP